MVRGYVLISNPQSAVSIITNEMQFIFLLCIVLLHITTLAATAAAATTKFGASERDRDALLAFKSNIIQDPHGIMSSWNESLHFCMWQGVTCSRRHKRVTILDLKSRGLVGSLSPHIGNLSFLKETRLENNSLQGKIPPEIGRLFRLQVLNLSLNSLEGVIPGNLSHCTNLEYLRLGFNKLVGKIPLELASLSKLRTLDFSVNNLTGGIPSFIGNFTSLQVLTAAGNSFTGSIPYTFGRLKNLRTLLLGRNELFGMIPLSIYNISSIEILSFSQNKLGGSLPSNLGLTLPNLQHLQIWENFLSGSIPVSLSNASNLELLEMSENNFSGKISVDFSGLRHLSSLILAANNLGSGEPDELRFLTSLVNCTNLKILQIQQNQFRGALPSVIGVSNFSTQLKILSMGENQISGRIPPWIGSLINLTILGMEHNRFTGIIPHDIGKLQQLQSVYLNNNMLSGEIPSSPGNLSLLNLLLLQQNHIRGSIPSALGNCQNLDFLFLYQNSLSGAIPGQLFNPLALFVLAISQNHLVGSLPPEIGNLQKLSRLIISENKLSGEIPSNLGRCNSLEYLYMEGNSFQGSIPPSLSNLKGIRDFYLSRNNLSGHVPSFLENFALEKLNLSFNDFEGELPTKGIFTNITAMSIIGNKKLCGGIPELQLPRCTIEESKRTKMSLALILIITAVCGLVGVGLVSSLLFYWFKKKREDQPLGSSLGESLLKVSYGSLLKATDGFSSNNLIGMGSFGSVYKGILDQDRTIVAVKVFNLDRRGASKSFMAECEALRSIRHRNLVKIVTSCSSVDFQGNDFKALIYEFMPNGSLEWWLHPNQDELHNLNLLQRINIAIDVACALDYLHHHSQKPIVHCDLKPSNILLDMEMTAHVGDFGLARFLPDQLVIPNQSSSVGIRGTIGYAAPEYGLGSEASTSGDVYSYGILLFEMMTGKRPTDPMFAQGLNLHNFARMALTDGVMEIVDPVLLNDQEEAAVVNNQSARNIGNRTMECLIFMVKIGVACSMESPQERMDISSVVHELHLVRNFFLSSMNTEVLKSLQN